MTQPLLITSTNPYAVTEIDVRGLFGYLNYQIPAKGSDKRINELALLLGDNGCGKTTILRTLLALLSPRQDAGHRSRIARTPFQRFSVTLASGATVTAVREQSGIGPFLHIVSIPGQLDVTCPFIAPDTSSATALSMEHSRALLAALSKVSPSFYFLTHDRDVLIEYNRAAQDPELAWLRNLETDVERARASRHSDPSIRRTDTVLTATLDRLVYLFQLRANQSARSGEATAHSVYTELVHSILRRSPQPSPGFHPLNTIRSRLLQLGARTDRYVTYGLASPISAYQLDSLLREATPTDTDLLDRILTPYLNGLEARLSALQDVFDQIDRLVKHLNRFLAPKLVSFTIQSGLSISLPTGTKLAAPMLSSGEQHLLLVLASAIIATASPCMLLIDEPEISLNVRWQRGLLDALIDCIQSSPVQIIGASHSMQLIGSHLNRACELSTGV